MSAFLSPRTAAGLLLAGALAACRGDDPGPLAPAPARAAPSLAPLAYSALDLGTLGGDESGAGGINRWGQVAGYSRTAGGGVHAFLWTRDGGMLDLGTLRGLSYEASRAYDINDAGRVVGESANRAFAWQNHVWQNLGVLPGHTRSAALGLNDDVEVVGYSTGPAGDVAFIHDGAMRSLGLFPGGTYSRAEAVNDDDVVVGHGDTPGGMRAFRVRHPGTLESLGVLPGGTASAAYDVNDGGQVVGYSVVAGVSQAFVWSRAYGMRALGGLVGGGGSAAEAISEGGRITGHAIAADGSPHAVLWRPDGAGGYAIADLGAVGGGPASGGIAISHSGRVVGVGEVGGVPHAMLWMEPNTLPIASAGGPYVTWTGTPQLFDASASRDPDGAIVGYDWSFSEGGRFAITTLLPRVGHVYQLPGTRSVTVRVRDSDGGARTATAAVQVLANRPPVAVIATGPITTMEGYPLSFSSAGSGDPDVGQPVSYLWDFGDGRVSRVPNPVRRFEDDGSFMVKLAVTDASGVVSLDSVPATVGNVLPTAVLQVHSVQDYSRLPGAVEGASLRLDAVSARDSVDAAAHCASPSTAAPATATTARAARTAPRRPRASCAGWG